MTLTGLETGNHRRVAGGIVASPAEIVPALAAFGYTSRSIRGGLLAEAASAAGVTVLMPLPEAPGGLAMTASGLVGPQAPRAAGIAALLAALGRCTRRPALLFLEAATIQSDLPPGPVISLEGGVAPRTWPGCFGSLDLLIRIIGRAADTAEPNRAINAIEEAVPLLQALLELKARLHRRHGPREDLRDSPLRRRLTINAAHGGFTGASLPVLFDVVVNRRYAPAERHQEVIEEIERVSHDAVRAAVRLEIQVTRHSPPLPDPTRPAWTAEQRALARGWGWPQVPFRSEPPLVPGCILFGGLQRPDTDPNAADATVPDADIAALADCLCAYLDAPAAATDEGPA